MPDTLRSFCNDMALLLQGHSDTPVLDARVLCSHVLGIDHSHFILDASEELSESQKDSIRALVARRLEGYCVASIIHEKDFYGRTFYVNENVLIPRPDTETLIEAALEVLAKGSRILDVCTGSGCIGLTLALETEASSLTLSDISPEALEVAQTNAHTYYKSANLVLSDLFQAIEGKFDIIAANPPYVTLDQYEALAPEVKREPSLALIGNQGLLDRLVKEACPHLQDKGWLFMELDPDQCKPTLMTMKSMGMVNLRSYRDLGGNLRVAAAQRQYHK